MKQYSVFSGSVGICSLQNDKTPFIFSLLQIDIGLKNTILFSWMILTNIELFECNPVTQISEILSVSPQQLVEC